MVERSDLVEHLAGWVAARSGTVRLAVDGPDNAGKTTLADELATVIEGRPAVRASIDGFHRPAVERYRRGELSPEGYYEDSFDLGALRSVLLDPLAPGGSRKHRTAVFDHVADSAVDLPELIAPHDVVLVFDGVFLLRPELAPFWDSTVFLDITEDEVMRRALVRDASLMGDQLRERYQRRYLPAQRWYCEHIRPHEVADVVIDNTDVNHPVVVKGPW